MKDVSQTISNKTISSHLELVGGVKGHFHHFLEAIAVVHDVPYSELSEF